MHGKIVPAGEFIGSGLKRLCAAQCFGLRRTSREARLQASYFISDRIQTVSPLFDIAAFRTHLSSERQSASRGSRVAGSSLRNVGVLKWWINNPSLLLSEMAETPGL